MERKELYQDDLTEERMPTPAQREENEHTMALDPDTSADDDDDDEEDDDDDDDDDEESEDLDD
ncbi:MAG: hypothetical protein NVSMB5_20310 [Candidatus Velthaea sp.]